MRFSLRPAAAATYSAKLAAPASWPIVARDINWNCGAGACQGATEESRPAVLCQALAKQAGKVDSFLVDGRAFSDAELDTLQRLGQGRQRQGARRPVSFPGLPVSSLPAPLPFALAQKRRPPPS